MSHTNNTYDQTEWQKAYSKVVAKAWSNSDYKNKLLNDPRAALSDMGLEVPTSLEISVMENSTQKMHLVLPAPPIEEPLDEGSLANIAGGYCIVCELSCK